MLPLLLGALLPTARAIGPDRGPQRDDYLASQAFDVTVQGVVGSNIDVKFRASAGVEFSRWVRSAGGEMFEVRGVLHRGKRKGTYSLDVDITPAVRKHREWPLSFKTDLVPGKKELICEGWSRWHEVKLVPVQ